MHAVPPPPARLDSVPCEATGGGGSEVHKSLASGPFQRKNLHLSPVKAKGGQHSRAVPSIAIITSQSFDCKHELVFGPKADLCIYVHR
jgi:hypothetical protein